MQFLIRPAEKADVPAIMSVMRAAQAQLPVADWFVADDETYLYDHLSGPAGFCQVATTEHGQVAAYFTVKLAGTAPDALGHFLGMRVCELAATAQMDSCCVAPCYQGNSLEGKLLLSAEARLRRYPGGPWRHALGTVHPDNAASLYSFLHRGYRIAAADQLCYGGKRRHILQKDWPDGI